MNIFSAVLALGFVFFGINSIAGAPGVPVIEIQPGSMFEKFGVMQGGRIISYDGKAIFSVNDSMEMSNQLHSKLVKTIIVMRDGKKHTLTNTVR